jgi:hypothetical protein
MSQRYSLTHELGTLRPARLQNKRLTLSGRVERAEERISCIENVDESQVERIDLKRFRFGSPDEL